MTKEEVLTNFYFENPKSIDDFTLESITLKEMASMFTNLADRVSKVQGGNVAVGMVNDAYKAVRAKVMENYINKFFSIARGTTMTDALERAKAKSEAKTLREGLPAYPGQIITFDVDGGRRFRVIDVDGNGKTMLVGLFSIGEVDEMEYGYIGGTTDSFCATWFNTLPANFKEAAEGTLLPNDANRIVHAPIMKGIKKALDKYNNGCYDWLWENDEDMSSFCVINDTVYGTAVMEGEEGEVFDYSDENFKPFEVHPCFVIDLNKYRSFWQDNEERAECKEHYEEVNAI